MSWWPFGSKKAIYEDPDALSELTRVAEETAKKKAAEAEYYRKEREREDYFRKQREQEKKQKEVEKQKEEEALDKFINEEYARIMSKKKPFKPF